MIKKKPANDSSIKLVGDAKIFIQMYKSF